MAGHSKLKAPQKQYNPKVDNAPRHQQGPGRAFGAVTRIGGINLLDNGAVGTLRILIERNAMLPGHAVFPSYMAALLSKADYLDTNGDPTTVDLPRDYRTKHDPNTCNMNLAEHRAATKEAINWVDTRMDAHGTLDLPTWLATAAEKGEDSNSLMALRHLEAIGRAYAGNEKNLQATWSKMILDMQSLADTMIQSLLTNVENGDVKGQLKVLWTAKLDPELKKRLDTGISAYVLVYLIWKTIRLSQTPATRARLDTLWLEMRLNSNETNAEFYARCVTASQDTDRTQADIFRRFMQGVSPSNQQHMARNEAMYDPEAEGFDPLPLVAGLDRADAVINGNNKRERQRDDHDQDQEDDDDNNGANNGSARPPKKTNSRCFNCDTIGHLARDCPHPTGGGSSSGGGNHGRGAAGSSSGGNGGGGGNHNNGRGAGQAGRGGRGGGNNNGAGRGGHGNNSGGDNQSGNGGGGRGGGGGQRGGRGRGRGGNQGGRGGHQGAPPANDEALRQERLNNRQCFKCGGTGHQARNCTDRTAGVAAGIANEQIIRASIDTHVERAVAAALARQNPQGTARLLGSVGFHSGQPGGPGHQLQGNQQSN